MLGMMILSVRTLGMTILSVRTLGMTILSVRTLRMIIPSVRTLGMTILSTDQSLIQISPLGKGLGLAVHDVIILF